MNESSGQAEKDVAVYNLQQTRDEQHEAQHGYVLDLDKLQNGASHLKTAADGHTILIPQPSDSLLDPLNWSVSTTKSVKIGALPADEHWELSGERNSPSSLLYQLCLFYQTSAAALELVYSFLNQLNVVQHNLVGNLICLGGGGLVAVALSEYFGRLPVIFYFTLMAFVTGIWCAVATSFDSYLAARIVNGFFAIVAQSGGLMWIKDIFFFHEHPRMINIFSGGVIIAPYLGPFQASFIINGASWRWAFWVYTILTGVGLLLVVGFLEETFYDRRVAPEQQSHRKSRLLRLLGFERNTTAPFIVAISRPAIAVSKVVILLIVVYYFLNFAWIIAVNATISVWMPKVYGFKPYQVGLFYFAPIIGSLGGELIGHWLHDMVGNFYRRRHGFIDPEARLILCYPAGILMGLGVLMIGLALQHQWHYMVVAVFWAVQICGIMIATTAVNAYLLDAYPEGSGEVCAWINVGRTLGGFMATYIEVTWVTKSGTSEVLGIQAGITWAAMVIPIVLQLFGKRVRQFQGPMRFLGQEK